MWAFLNPMFLAAAAAAVVPLILHLLSRRKTIRMTFSALRFLKVAQKQSSHRVRMERFLLWLVRTLLLLAVALAFAQPVLRRQGGWGGLGRSSRDIGLVVDISYSMDYASGARRTWEQTREAALSILSGLQRGDRVCLYLAGPEPVPIFAEPRDDIETVTARLKSLKPSAESSDLRAATDAVFKALEKSGRREREVFVLTDGQVVPWRGWSAPTRTEAAAVAATNHNGAGKAPVVFVALLGAANPENAAPELVTLTPPVMRAGVPAKLQVRVGATGDERNVPVTLYMDDREVARQEAAVGGGAVSADVTFALEPLPEGIHIGRVETAADALTIDNTFHFLIKVRGGFQVLVVGGREDAFFVSKALTAGASPFAARVVEPAAVVAENLSACSAVFLCNAMPLPGASAQALEQYVRGGGLLAIFPGTRAVKEDYAALSCLPALPVGVVDIPRDQQRKTIRLLRQDDPIFASLTLPPGAIPSIAMQRRLQWGDPTPDAVDLLVTDAEDGFLKSKAFGDGRVLMFAVTGDRSWSNLPLTPIFLPLLHQIAYAGSGLARDPLWRWCGREVELPGTLVAEARLTAPDGSPVRMRDTKGPTGMPRRYAEDVALPGIYSAAGAPVFAANAPRDESILDRVDEERIPEWIPHGRVLVAQEKDDLMRMVEEHRIGRPLAIPLLWLALFLAMAELAMSNWASRRKPTLSDKMVVQLSGKVAAEDK